MRGFLFTLSLVITALVIISLSIFVMESGRSEKADILSISMFDRIRNNMLWVENGFRGMVEAAGVDVTVKNYTVSITENLPNNNAANFSDNVDNWTAFATARADFPMSFSVSNVKNYLPLIMRPSQVVYTHPNNFGGNSIRVENAGSVTNYTIDISINTDEAFTLNWDTIDNNPADLDVQIKVRNSTTESTENHGLDPDSTSTLSISMSSGTITINIGGLDSGRLVINNPTPFDTTVTTNITLGNIKNPMITFPGQVISLQSDIINASASSPGRIA